MANPALSAELQQLITGLAELPNMRREIAELRRMRAELSELRAMISTRMSRQEVCERLGLHRNTLADYIRDGRFPAPGRDGKWSSCDVAEWERTRMGER